MNTMPDFHENKRQISTLDFRDNKQLIISYLLRVLGTVAFGWLFYTAANIIHPEAELTFESLVTISINGVPDIVSIGLILFVVIFVLWLHELVHASVFYVHTGAPPHIGIRGPIIFASAEGYLNTRNAMNRQCTGTIHSNFSTRPIAYDCASSDNTSTGVYSDGCKCCCCWR